MKNVIICGKRADVPAFHYDWLQKVLAEKKAELINEYNQQKYTVDLNPEKTHSISLWSKNFANVIKDPGELDKYNLYFQFTITGYGKTIEPNVPTVEESLKQIKTLAERYSPEQIMWRFDPISLFKLDKDSKVEDLINERVEMFKYLCCNISKSGVKNCTISFTTFYKHVIERLMKSGISYIEANPGIQKELSSKLVTIAKENNIQIYSCANPILENMDGILKGHCVDGETLTKLFGEKASRARASGQREACGCTKATDISSYSQKCGHGCRYCYLINTK